MRVAQDTYTRDIIYRRLARKYGVKPDPFGCWLLWPDCIRELRREYLLKKATRKHPPTAPKWPSCQ